MKCLSKISHITLITLALVLLPICGINLFAAVSFQEEDVPLTQEEVDAYNKELEAMNAAVNEEDPARRCELLLQFIGKYPESEHFEIYIKPEYPRALFQLSEAKKYQELEIAAEKWLELYPDNLQTIGYAASAAIQLQHDEKSLKYLLMIYEQESTAEWALAIAQVYDKLDDLDKYVEWCDNVFTYPEQSVNYKLRFDLVDKFAAIEDLARASTYAAKTLEILDFAETPDAAGLEDMRRYRRTCHHIIARKLYGDESFNEAISSFKNALKVEVYQEGFYYIGQCYWRLNDPETAHDYFAVAELMGGELTEKAKEYKENLYKPFHNNTLIGIEKVHKRAQAILDSYSGNA